MPPFSPYLLDNYLKFKNIKKAWTTAAMATKGAVLLHRVDTLLGRNSKGGVVRPETSQIIWALSTNPKHGELTWTGSMIERINSCFSEMKLSHSSWMLPLLEHAAYYHCCCCNGILNIKYEKTQKNCTLTAATDRNHYEHNLWCNMKRLIYSKKYLPSLTYFPFINFSSRRLGKRQMSSTCLCPCNTSQEEQKEKSIARSAKVLQDTPWLQK